MKPTPKKTTKTTKPVWTFNTQTYDEKSRTIYENSRILINGSMEETSNFKALMIKEADLYVPLNIVHALSKLKNVIATSSKSHVTVDLSEMKILDTNEASDAAFLNVRKGNQLVSVQLQSKNYPSLEQWKIWNLKQGDVAFIHSVRKTTSSIWIKFGVLTKKMVEPHIKKKIANETLESNLKPSNGVEKIRAYVNSPAFVKDIKSVYGQPLKESKAYKKLISLDKKLEFDFLKSIENQNKVQEQIKRVAEGLPVINTKEQLITVDNPNLTEEERVIVKPENGGNVLGVGIRPKIVTWEEIETKKANYNRIVEGIPNA